jgi:hypothetical protein
VLPRSDELVKWDTSWSGTLRTEFPLAVRLIVMDERGRLIDWLFETHVKAPE